MVWLPSASLNNTSVQVSMPETSKAETAREKKLLELAKQFHLLICYIRPGGVWACAQRTSSIWGSKWGLLLMDTLSSGVVPGFGALWKGRQSWGYLSAEPSLKKTPAHLGVNSGDKLTFPGLPKVKDGRQVWGQSCWASLCRSFNL